LGDADIIEHATDYYKGLFGEAPDTDLRLEGLDENQLNEEDRAELTKSFDLEEIRDVVFDLKHNKAAGLDGHPVEFYRFLGDYQA
jgi:hypothetical protein